MEAAGMYCIQRDCESVHSLQEAGTADLGWLDPDSPSYQLPWSMRKVGVLCVPPTVTPLSTICLFIYGS